MFDQQQNPRLYFFRHNRQVSQIQGTSALSLLVAEELALAQLHHEQGSTHTTALATDTNHSVLEAVTASGTPHRIAYLPYGFCPQSPPLPGLPGFNGEIPDPMTGHYLLGAGYRMYNPVLMRFHSSDSWSPFGVGECNGYAYAICDPLNHTDPTGHVRQRGPKGSSTQKPSRLITPSQDNTADSRVMSWSNFVPSSAAGSLTPPTPPTPFTPLSQNSSTISRYSWSSSLSGNDRGWKLNKSNAQFKKSGLSDAEQRSFDTFQNAIHNFGLSPKNAASLVGGADYKQLDKNTNLYQIRLSQSQRVTFIVKDKVATIRQVGGHT